MTWARYFLLCALTFAIGAGLAFLLPDDSQPPKTVLVGSCCGLVAK